jgi:hypothetical protein
LPERLAEQYRELKRLAASNLAAASVSKLISEMALYSRTLLQGADRVELTSEVEGKRYFGFRGDEQSRPLNEGLYVTDEDQFKRLLRALRGGFRRSSPQDTVTGIYTTAYSVFAANDVYGVGRKASATFFEILIGHVVSRWVGVPPRKKVRIPESGAELPTDYVFDLGGRANKLHLPIKTSTRERAVQAWVHQLVLDRIFGSRVYTGVLVVAAETKRDARSGEVIEICVPNQFQMFQSRVAELARVYYLDPPDVYLALARARPQLQVKSFGEARGDLRALLGA